MGIFIFLIIAAGVVGFTVGLKDARYNTSNKHNGANESLENLYKIQSYEFWRDFGERGEQKKT